MVKENGNHPEAWVPGLGVQSHALLSGVWESNFKPFEAAESRASQSPVRRLNSPANRIFLLHTHPSSSPFPSQQALSATAISHQLNSSLWPKSSAPLPSRDNQAAWDPMTAQPPRRATVPPLSPPVQPLLCCPLQLQGLYTSSAPCSL